MSASNPTFRSGFVAVVGRPNVGKSTLMNTLLEQKIAIVTPRAQTTRTRQLGILTDDEFQLIFIDTPGIIKKVHHRLDRFLLTTALESLQDADVVLWLCDLSSSPGQGDRQIASYMAELPPDKPLILALNKLDITKPEHILENSAAYRDLAPDAAWLAFSAKANAGVDELQQMLVERLPEGPLYFPPDQVTDVYMRTISAELIREQILLQLRDEIPHAIAVEIKEFQEKENGVTVIQADIIVEREGHKRIVIGKKGSRIREIGARSRKEIEALIDGKLFLDLFVKVTPDWRQRASVLRRLGYAEQA